MLLSVHHRFITKSKSLLHMHAAGAARACAAGDAEPGSEHWSLLVLLLLMLLLIAAQRLLLLLFIAALRLLLLLLLRASSKRVG